MKYDDASWHYGGDFPEDLPPEAGATHIGMFLAWALVRGFAGSLHTEEFPDELESLKGRRITPARFLIQACDEKLTNEEFNEEGNAFARHYYGEGGRMGEYIEDYQEVLCSKTPTLYHVADTWENFDRLSPRIEQRYQEWKNQKGWLLQ
jgi:hypothetical protein